jgi:hypothetical protein
MRMKAPIFAVFVVAVGMAQTAPQPTVKSVPFSPADQQAIAALNAQAAKLNQEERAVQAERSLLQMQADKILDAACKAAGGDKCRADSQDADPRKWTLMVVEPKPEAPKK